MGEAACRGHDQGIQHYRLPEVTVRMVRQFVRHDPFDLRVAVVSHQRVGHQDAPRWADPHHGGIGGVAPRPNPPFADVNARRAGPCREHREPYPQRVPLQRRCLEQPAHQQPRRQHRAHHGHQQEAAPRQQPPRIGPVRDRQEYGARRYGPPDDPTGRRLQQMASQPISGPLVREAITALEKKFDPPDAWKRGQFYRRAKQGGGQRGSDRQGQRRCHRLGRQ